MVKLAEIQKKAGSLGIKNTQKKSKTDLIRAIQKQEGNFDCFGTSKGYCDQDSCMWRSDCL